MIVVPLMDGFCSWHALVAFVIEKLPLTFTSPLKLEFLKVLMPVPVWMIFAVLVITMSSLYVLPLRTTPEGMLIELVTIKSVTVVDFSKFEPAPD